MEFIMPLIANREYSYVEEEGIPLLSDIWISGSILYETIHPMLKSLQYRLSRFNINNPTDKRVYMETMKLYILLISFAPHLEPYNPEINRRRSHV